MRGGAWLGRGVRCGAWLRGVASRNWGGAGRAWEAGAAVLGQLATRAAPARDTRSAQVGAVRAARLWAGSSALRCAASRCSSLLGAPSRTSPRPGPPRPPRAQLSPRGRRVAVGGARGQPPGRAAVHCTGNALHVGRAAKAREPAGRR